MHTYLATVEGQILAYWNAYRGHCLAGRWLSAAHTMEKIDRLLDRLAERPRPASRSASTSSS